MEQYLEIHPWKIIESGFSKEKQILSESIFSIGNGYMGQRANFEEKYSGESLQGNYVAGVYYPDKTVVGWWKIGYPEYFAKVLNSTNWIGIDIKVNGQELNLAECKVEDFVRTLDMKKGLLRREFVVEFDNGNRIRVESSRFISMTRAETAAISYSVKALNFSGIMEIRPYLDGDVINQDANYGEKFWDEAARSVGEHEGYLMLKTKKMDFHICTYMSCDLRKNNQRQYQEMELISREKYVANRYCISVGQDEELSIYKYIANTSSRYYPVEDLIKVCREISWKALDTGFDSLLAEHERAWTKIWEKSDIKIEGDLAAQQGIRFNIFQVNQTYTGKDERLNIGPKGFTGEKYGGSTYWDTEGYCLPFYLGTAEQSVAKNLLLYRYHHLEKAKENAKKLGFSGAAALYPMVTMNGEECHNEWEITFEEIHRNAVIAYAIYNYIKYTGDKLYLLNYGFEVLAAITRFWAERVNFSERKNKYVILGVTGPNEYENNVNNNWYTNRMAVWTLEYTLGVLEFLEREYPIEVIVLKEKLGISSVETQKWQDIIENMYYPLDEKLGIFLQQDNYLDKELLSIKDLDEEELPLNQNWSWDRILRSCFIKQADVLQGLYFLEDSYDLDTIRRNFNFYEPKTVHESSLSPSIHAVLAAKIGEYEKAYEMFLRTARLDLDNYNNDSEDGCHITSMAGSWLAVVHGFGGFRVKDDIPVFNPCLPAQWKSYSFKINFRGVLLSIAIGEEDIKIFNDSNKEITIGLYEQKYRVTGNSSVTYKK